MLTARRDESDKVLGLDSGADGDLTKPFCLRSIVKAIAEQHGGSVTARNDHGAIFEIALPH